jgi:hypothetical protein
MLLNGGYLAGSGGGMDSSPVAGGVSTVCEAAGEGGAGLEQAARAPNRIKAAKFRARFPPA